MPTTKDLIRGLGEQTQNWNSILRESENLGRLAGQGFDTKKLITDLKNVGSQAGVTGKQIDKAFVDGRKSLDRFNMAWLSIMFGGMAIQRVFGRIGRSSLKSFNTVMSSVEGATTAVSMLSVNFEYLKFTIGQAISTALEPFIPYIIQLVEWASDWIQQHPETVFWAIAGAFAVGSALAAGGSFYLFVDGMARLAGTSLKGIGGIPGIFKSIGAAAKAHPAIAAVAAALAIIAGLTWKAFKETPEAWNSIKNSMTLLKEPVKFLIENIDQMVESISIGGINSWEDLAWVMAWGITGAIRLTGDLITSLSALLGTLRALWNAWQLVWDAMRGDFKGAKRDWQDLRASMDQIVKSFKQPSLLAAFPLSVQEFKKQELMKQGYAVGTTPEGRVINIGKVEMSVQAYQGMSAEDLIQKIIMNIERRTG